MEELYNFGINNDDLKIMIEINPEILEISKEEIKEKENLFKYIGCTLEQIKNILITNPMVLTRLKEDLVNLIQKLTSLGFNMLNILFEANPYILNINSFEIDKYIKKRQSMGEVLDDIVDDLDSNPYLFNEM